MQSTRKVVYATVSNLNGAVTAFSNASTKGELFKEIPDLEVLSKGMKPWIKGATANDKGYGLTSDDTKLPEGDFVLYFLVDKNDSGN